jgi:hypothetical protein
MRMRRPFRLPSSLTVEIYFFHALQIHQQARGQPERPQPCIRIHPCPYRYGRPPLPHSVVKVHQVTNESRWLIHDVSVEYVAAIVVAGLRGTASYCLHLRKP